MNSHYSLPIPFHGSRAKKLDVMGIATIGTLLLVAFIALQTPRSPVPITLTQENTVDFSNGGVADLKIASADFFDPATTYTSGTEFKASWWYKVGTTYINLGANTLNDQNIPAAANEVLYVSIHIPTSGQNYYHFFRDTLAHSDLATSVSYFDLDNDGVLQWVYTLNLNNKIAKPQATGTDPQVSFQVILAPYQAPTINAPADQANIGTTRVTKFVQWETTNTATKKSFAISKVELQANNTNVEQYVLNSITICEPERGGLGVVPGSSFVYFKDSTNQYWTWTASPNSLDGAIYYHQGVNDLLKCSLTLSMDFTLASNTFVNLKLTVYYITAGGTVSTVTDTVKIDD